MPSRDLTNLEYALLGLVGNGEISAYTARQIFTETGMARFSNSPGSIYPALRRLKAQGWLDAREVDGARGRTKQVFRLTDAGESIINAWLTRPLTYEEVTTQSDVLMLRFSFMEGRCSKTQTHSFVLELRDGLERQAKELDEKVDNFKKTGRRYAELTLKAGLMTTRAHIRWTDLVLREL